MEEYSNVADLFLYWGNRAYWYAFECAGDNGLAYLEMARRCGQVALGAMVQSAGIVVHELAHYFYNTESTTDDNHCVRDCCMPGLGEIFFYGRVRSILGVPEVRGTKLGIGATQPNVDAAFSRTTRSISPTCTSASSGLTADVASTMTFQSIGTPGGGVVFSGPSYSNCACAPAGYPSCPTPSVGTPPAFSGRVP